MAEELQRLYSGLEQQVAARTADLERRSSQLETAAQVAREAAAIQDVGRLLDTTVHHISERFGFYHAGLFLVDEAGESAVLQVASSEGGRHMLARGHKLKVGEEGIVGYVAATGDSRIALDVEADAVFLNNPDLPGTRSEVALPLKVRGQVIGVLDIQSTQESAFSEENVAILQTMADQVALAIANARLLEESQSALRELETLYGRRVREIWQERQARQPAAYRYTGVGVEAVAPSFALERGGEGAAGAGPAAGEAPAMLVAPIRLREQTIGSIVLQRDPDQNPWSAEEVSLVEELSTQIALALENAHLLEETQRRAEQEQILGQMTARFTRSLDMDTLLQTAVRELGQLLQVDEVSVHIGPPPDRVQNAD
jgi:GAF domain-containing protein